ncbi:MAG TPA: hypothetical protein VGS62_02730 [Streptosporangiaceae bacterium]|nr:hypothetical protein [Streptosporangiaceae bacterium]
MIPMRSYVSRALPAVGRGVRKACSVIAEFQRQQERFHARMMSYDTHMLSPDTPPQTYAEFLLGTGGSLRHEPSARARQHGHSVR